MKIPKVVKVFGYDFHVEFDEDMSNKENQVGEVNYQTETVRLAPINETRSLKFVEGIYLHEMLHLALRLCGYDKINDDEAFVEVVSNTLHQILTTSEGDLVDG